MKKYILLALCAVLSAWLGISLSQRDSITHQSNPFIFEGIGRDGWSEKDFRIELQSILKDMGEHPRVTLHLSGWRPPGSKSPDAVVSLCGETITRPIQQEDEAFGFSITRSSCPTPELLVNLSNTFLSSDGRRLGLRINKLSIHSGFGTEVFYQKSVWVTAVTLLILFLLLQNSWLIGSSAFISVYLLSLMHWDSTHELFMLGVCIISLIIGIKRTHPSPGMISDQVSRMQRKNYVYITLLLLAALAIRLYGIDFGLPHYFHPDELRKGRIAEKMFETGDLDPNYFLHPTLLLYSSAAVGAIEVNIFGAESTKEQFTLAGREVSAFAGVGAVLLTVLLGSWIAGFRVGLFAGMLLAFSPLAITCSRYLKEDSLLVFWTLSACAFSLWGSKENKPRLLLLAGICSGLAASSKYSGMLTILPVLSFPLAYKRFSKEWIAYAIGAVCLVPIGFVAASPYTILNFDKFLEDFDSERKHMVIGHHATIISAWDHFWSYHLARSILPALGIIPIIVGMMAAGVSIRHKHFPLLAVLGAAVMFYAPAEYVNAKPPPQPERYILPAIPFISILAAYGIFLIQTKWIRVLSVLCSIIGILIPSLLLAREVPNDTRNRMRDWMIENVPQHSKIMIDAIPYTPAFPDNQFDILRLANPEDRRGMTIDSLKEQGVQYVLVTSLSYERYFHTRTSDQIIRRRFEDLFLNAELVHEVVPQFRTYGFHNPTLKLLALK